MKNLVAAVIRVLPSDALWPHSAIRKYIGTSIISQKKKNRNMPVIGFFAATLLAGFLAAVDHWIAFLLLALVGGKMIREGILFNPEEEEKKGSEECGCCNCPPDFFSPKALFTPAVATSLDALAVGAGLAFAGNSIWLPALSMGVVTAIISATGVLVGRKLGSLAGERIMIIVGGSAIVLIGLKILLEHLGIL